MRQPNSENNTKKLVKSAAVIGDHKLKVEKAKMSKEHHDRIVKMELMNRKKELENIRPADDLRILRL